MDENELRAIVRLEVEQENLSKQFDKHEILDNTRFGSLTDKIDSLQKNQTKIMTYGVAAFTVVSFLMQYVVKLFG